MEVLLRVGTDDFHKFRGLLLKDELASKASIKFKEGKEGYYCYIRGTDKHCKKALELAGDEEGNLLAEEITGEEKEKVINKIKADEDKAIEGFGNLFG